MSSCAVQSASTEAWGRALGIGLCISSSLAVTPCRKPSTFLLAIGIITLLSRRSYAQNSPKMAENVPPNSAPSATAAADQPGRPYYESLRSTLRQTLDKKRKLDEQLAALEENIYKTEGAYLEETANSGNIVRGFDGWVKGVQIGSRSAVDGSRRGGRVREEDRVFSRSSVSWMRVS